MGARPLNVRSKLALVFFSACALTFGVAGSFISSSVTGTLQAEVLKRMEYQSRAYVTALDGYLSMLAGRTEDFASDGFVRDAGEALMGGLEDPEAHSDALMADLRQHLLVNKLPMVKAFSDLHLVSTDGHLLLAAVEPPAPNYLKWLASQEPDQGLLVSDLMAGDGGAEHAKLAIATPLLSRAGGCRIGWLIAWVKPCAWIFGAFGSSSLGVDADRDTQGWIRLLDPQGARLSLASDAFESGWPSPDSESAANGIGVTFLASDQRPPITPRVSPRHEAFVRRFPMSTTGWSLEVESTSDEALAAVVGMQGRFFGIGLLVAAAAGLFFLLPMGVLTRPLLQLAEAARRVGDGDYSSTVKIESNDEFGAVGRSFAAMTKAVQERTRLQERTAEDLRKRQGELRAERDRLKAVIASMRGGLIVIDADGKPVVSNQRAEPILRELMSGGLDLKAHHVCDRATRSDAACHACLFDPSRSPKSCQVEIGGRTYEVHASELPPDADGRVGRVLVSHDFTDRVIQDERMIHQERLAVLGEVAAVMAHELNNPLAAISMYNQMLAVELDDQPELAENVQVIQRNVESCKGAIRELLDYATAASPEIDAIDIMAVLEDVAVFTRPLRERAEVELSVQGPKEPVLAWGDELQVRQIFVNLVMNAVQAMGPAGGKVSIDVSVDGGHVSATISDNGPGIPAETQRDIFKAFFTTKGRGKGTGLGLPTARRIAEMHGGGVELVESSNTGSVFRVRLVQQEAVRS
ncbi:MAG: signal transduction histidine kinase [Planctomycetota bacterium]|jgi:signal transduction histidine kinase